MTASLRIKLSPFIIVLILAVVPVEGAVVINEFMAVNGQTVTDPQNEYEDWIELYNDSNDPIDIGDMYLTDDPSDPTRWPIPATIMPARSYLLIWADGDTESSGLHAGFKLDADGEQIALFAADGVTLLDEVTFGRQTPDVSYGRSPDGADLWGPLVRPTPGTANGTAFVGRVADPVFSHERGFYDDAFSLSMTCATPGASIYFTVNGSHPLDDDVVLIPYLSPLPIQNTLCIRAVAIKPDWQPSGVVTHTFLMNQSEARQSLPVISLVGSRTETFYAPNGVMAIVGGQYSSNGTWVRTTPDSYNNILERGLERPVSCEWIGPENDSGFQIDCGIRVHGSDYLRPRYRTNSKFSFRLYFRREYGQSPLDYPLFPFEVDQFKSIVLRGGHNDASNPFIKDELIRRLLKDMGHVSSGGTFAQVYINGEYKGYYNPCEHITEAFCRSWFDSELDWDIITMFGGTREGDREHVDQLMNYVLTHDLSQPEAYETVARQVDLVEFIDYLILRLWSGDWDWPHNNWSAARERSDSGQWRFFVWDAEGGMFPDRLNTVYFGNLHSTDHENGILYSNLIENPRFRGLFGDQLAKHFSPGGALSQQHIRTRFQEMQAQMQGVLPNMNTYVIDTWVPQRESIFLTACSQEGVYTFAGPVLAVNGRTDVPRQIQTGDILTLTPPEGNGTIYYTSDGSDPLDLSTASPTQWQTILSAHQSKRVLVPRRSEFGETWTGGRPFNDSEWLLVEGDPGGVGYERGSGYQSLLGIDLGNQMYGLNATCYIRIPFTFTGDLNTLGQMRLRIQYDDGFVAYLNGTEIARRNANGAVGWNATASTGHDDGAAVNFEPVNVTEHLRRLRTGDNLLAIHALNVSTTSSDLLIRPELDVGPPVVVAVGDQVLTYNEPIALSQSAHIKARILKGNQWSVLTEAVFSVGPIADSLRISELMYHPEDRGDAHDPNTEYIELTNIGASDINLNYVQFTDGIEYTFPAITLAPNEFILVVKDVTAFERRYGADLPVAGQYTGRLNNGGERVELRDAADALIQEFEYSDNWYDNTDGEGYSLTVVSPDVTDVNSLSEMTHWRPSLIPDGSPGWQDNGL